MKKLWNKETEELFFREASKFSSPEQLFYKSSDSRYYAYWPKGYKGKKTTLQSRNALIGQFTEKWSKDILSEFANDKNIYIIQNVVCEEIGLTNKSPADIALCKTNDTIQKAKNIISIFEVKMSVVWNWELLLNENKLVCLGDYSTHQGNPGLLRSDSMLKAIGKSINIRVSSYKAAKIPIIILGNTPITDSYYDKVDHLKETGIIQGFWSLNPQPRDNNTSLKKTEKEGFYRVDSYEELLTALEGMLSEEKLFFSSMKTKKELGEIIEIANKEISFEKKAEKFLFLIRA